jgi:UDP-N-acetylglucosamine acyltransferase
MTTAWVHPTSVVHAGATLGDGVQVGPFCLVGPDVVIGADSVLHSHVVVTGRTTIGRACGIHPFAVLGGAPQDRKYHGEPSDLIVGDEVVIREHVTVHRGTGGGEHRTAIGDRSLLMATCHVAHDCVVGHDVVMANGATLAGHVMVECHAVLGGFSAVGQMLRIGESAMLAAGAMVEQDAPPYCTVAGDRAKVRALNVVGLRRRGFDTETVSRIRSAFRILFRSGLALDEAVAAVVERVVPRPPEVDHLLEFLGSSRRGVSRRRPRAASR